MPKTKSKRPATEFNPPAAGKVPRGGSIADRIPKMNFSWRVDRIDLDGDWGWRQVPSEVIMTEIIPKLQDYETMIWSTVEGQSGSHFVPVQNLCSAAQNRLKEINQSDVESLFSLRMTGQRRVWGIRDGAVFRVLWWDPKHEVCPSVKKHT